MVTGVATVEEPHSRVCELEAKVEDLERKVATLYMDNVALMAKLDASHPAKRLQQEEIINLTEQPEQDIIMQVN